MKRRIVLLIAAVAVVIMAIVGVGITRAFAHNFDDASYFTCAATAAPNSLIDHSWPYQIEAGWVYERCMTHDATYGWQYCYAERWNVQTHQIIRFTSYYLNCPWDPHQT